MEKSEMQTNCEAAVKELETLLKDKADVLKMDLNEGVYIELKQERSLDFDEIVAITEIKKRYDFDGLFVASDFGVDDRLKKVVFQLVYNY